MTARSSDVHAAPASPAGAAVSPGRRMFLAALVLAILFLVFMGAQVKSHNAGLAVPDWPGAYGQVWPRMVGGVFHEHWHRAVASGVGLLAIVAAVWCARRERRRWVRGLAWGLLAAVIVQGLLGWLTVKHLLPPEISASHAGLAQTVLCLSAWLAYACSTEWTASSANPARPGPAVSPLPVSRTRALRGAVAALVALYVQLALGAWMRHTEAGLAVPFFPVDGTGRLLPEYVDAGVIVHMAHRGFAVVVLLLVWRAVHLSLRTRSGLMLHGAALAAAVGTQGLLGAGVIWSSKHPALTSVHVANGALVLLLTWLLVLRVWRTSAPGPAFKRMTA